MGNIAAKCKALYFKSNFTVIKAWIIIFLMHDGSSSVHLSEFGLEDHSAKGFKVWEPPRYTAYSGG